MLVATCAFVCLGAAVKASASEPQKVAPSEVTIFVAKRVRTFDAGRPIAEAIAVRGDKIVALGSREELLKGSPGARVFELPNATIVPGLVDAHGHLASLGRSLSIVDLVETTTKQQVLERLKAAPPTSYQGNWLVGRGWDQTRWPKGQQDFPTREDLDSIFPKTPVFLTRVDGHAAWVNGEALRRAGISRKTKDPPGGRIVRDRRGEPTGVLVDNAMHQAESQLPAVDEQQLEARLSAALSHCAQLGLTAAHDAGMDSITFGILRRWDEADRLPVRVYAMADGQGKDAKGYLAQGPYQGKMLTMRAVKFWFDGALGSRGAALDAPYADDSKQSGLLLIPAAELETRVKSFMQRGFQVAIHAIGDRANRLALDLLSRAAEGSAKGGRHRIEHAQILHREDIPRFGKLGIIASMQPTHATSDMRWVEARLGKERSSGAYVWNSLMRSGAVLAFGSDFPVEGANPLLGIYAARTRQDARGEPVGGWMPEERLTAEDAVRAFTWGPAYAAFAETHRGTLKAGFDADFVALSVDPVEAPAPELLSAKALLTVVGGRVAFDARARR